MFCTKCGAEMKDGAKFCPKCGDQTGPETDDYDKYFTVEESTEDKGKKKYYIVGAIAVAAIAFLLCFCNTNTFKRIFYKPADYYRYVERKNIHRNLEQLGGWLDAAGMDGSGDKVSGREEALKLNVSDEILDAVSGAIGIDASFLSEVNITGKSTVYNELYSGIVNLSLGQNRVISLDAISDASNSSIYLRIPELSDRYLGVDLKTIESFLGKPAGGGEFNPEDPATYIDKIGRLPEAAKLMKIAERYSDKVFENLDDVKKSKKMTLELGGVEQKCWELTVELDYKDAKKLGEVLYDEIKDDDELKKLVIESSEGMGMDGEDMWDDLLELADDLKDSVTEIADSEMKVYVDSKGRVICREFLIGDDKEVTVKYGRAIHGREFGVLLDVDIDGDSYCVEGNGRKSGENYSGDFTLSGKGIEPIGFTLDSFDHKAFNKQKLVGQVSVKISDITDALNIGNFGFSMLEDYLAVISVKAKDKTAYDIDLKLTDEKTEPLICTYSFKKTGGSKISIPDNAIMVEEITDIKEYIDEADFDKLEDNLERAGVPDSLVKYVSYIQRLADYLDYLDMFY